MKKTNSIIIPPDIELIKRLRKSDDKAFDLLYSKYAVNLYKFAYYYLKSKEDAEGLVQMVFMKIWEKRKTIKPDTSFKSFIYTITYNDLCVLFRKRKYKRKFIKESKLIRNETKEMIEEGIDYKNTLEKIDNIVDHLPKKQREIFLKSRHEGMSSKEIAKEFGLSPGTVDNYISATLKFIKSKLKKESLFNST